ncbi:MAG: globin domain-containing protein [Anaerolineae bacterium]
MSLTSEQKQIVQTTFGQIPNADQLAARFYTRLFEIDPTTQVLFKHDMAAQRMKLVQTLAVVVHGLEDFDSLVPAIQSLARRHIGYGVNNAHWSSVGAALLWALQETFGTAYTSEVHSAWEATYALITETALAAAPVDEGDLS